MIVRETAEMEDVTVVGCALAADLGRISVRGIPNSPGMQATIFERISATGAIVDDIIQTEAGDTANVSFMVDRSDLPDVKVAMERVLQDAGTGDMAIETGLAKISAVGVGMRTHAGVAATMFRALGDAGIHIANISTSEIKISCIVPEGQGEDALRVVHDAFGLGDTPQSPVIGMRAESR